MSEPNYADYSLQDLRSVEKHIDKDRYPERLERALEELAKREAQGVSPQDAQAPKPDKLGNRVFVAILVSLIAIGAAAIGITSVNKNQEAEVARAKSQLGVQPVREAVEASVSAERVSVRLEGSAGKRVIAVDLTNADLSKNSEEEVAEKLALAAYNAFEKPRRLDSVRVVFSTETKKFLSKEKEIGDPHKFTADDLKSKLP